MVNKFLLLILVLAKILLGVLARPQSRVVGGEDAFSAQFPYQISLRVNHSHVCGGSIITPNYILTASHCIGDFDNNQKFKAHNASWCSIRAGSTDRLKGGVLVQVSEIIPHENYGQFLNDIALLRLKKPLIYSENIQPISLATNEPKPGASIIISGWGLLKNSGLLAPQKLQWNTLSMVSQKDCKDQIQFDSKSLICLSHKVDNGACQGDSGGPAQYKGQLVGVANFVYGGCGTNNPDGYANVVYHTKWIKDHSDL